ncbi:MAG: Succinyl-CoA--L-malate CoA-transferase beta subunit [Pseudomonadales bacterium]|nr:Succinyl-CoA--L-malate CoA-transferase beta subunit [Pseudomonadales bacterium]
MSIAALDGVRVIELGAGISAAFCARVLADYGASVLKIEPPDGGDLVRHWGPFPGDTPHPEKSGTFLALNAGKRSITLDVGSPQGRELLFELLADADVLVENNPPARMRDWGLDYDALAGRFPRLIMVSITPFGQTGPYADWKGYDLNAFHLTAAGSRYCGAPDREPLEHGTFSADYYGGYVGATWALASLFAQDELGGEHLDVSCAEAIAASFTGCQNIGDFAQNGTIAKRTGVGMALAAPATILPCRDGHVWMMALETAQWKGLVHAMGDPEWARLELFDSMFTRAQNADLIYAMMTEWTAGLGKQEIMDLCQANGCPSTAVYTIGDAGSLAHLHERGYFARPEHPLLGQVRILGAPVHVPESPGGPASAAPLLGQHNSEIYRDRLGLDDTRLAALHARGIV